LNLNIFGDALAYRGLFELGVRFCESQNQLLMLVRAFGRLIVEIFSAGDLMKEQLARALLHGAFTRIAFSQTVERTQVTRTNIFLGFSCRWWGLTLERSAHPLTTL